MSKVTLHLYRVLLRAAKECEKAPWKRAFLVGEPEIRPYVGGLDFFFRDDPCAQKRIRDSFVANKELPDQKQQSDARDQAFAALRAFNRALPPTQGSFTTGQILAVLLAVKAKGDDKSLIDIAVQFGLIASKDAAVPSGSLQELLDPEEFDDLPASLEELQSSSSAPGRRPMDEQEDDDDDEDDEDDQDEEDDDEEEDEDEDDDDDEDGNHQPPYRMILNLPARNSVHYDQFMRYADKDPKESDQAESDLARMMKQAEAAQQKYTLDDLVAEVTKQMDSSQSARLRFDKLSIAACMELLDLSCDMRCVPLALCAYSGLKHVSRFDGGVAKTVVEKETSLPASILTKLSALFNYASLPGGALLTLREAGWAAHSAAQMSTSVAPSSFSSSSSSSTTEMMSGEQQLVSPKPSSSSSSVSPLTGSSGSGGMASTASVAAALAAAGLDDIIHTSKLPRSATATSTSAAPFSSSSLISGAASVLANSQTLTDVLFPSPPAKHNSVSRSDHVPTTVQAPTLSASSSSSSTAASARQHMTQRQYLQQASSLVTASLIAASMPRGAQADGSGAPAVAPAAKEEPFSLYLLNHALWASCQNEKLTFELFDFARKWLRPNVNTFNALTYSCGFHGKNPDRALALLEQMESYGLGPDLHCYNNVLHSFNRKAQDSQLQLQKDAALEALVNSSTHRRVAVLASASASASADETKTKSKLLGISYVNQSLRVMSQMKMHNLQPNKHSFQAAFSTAMLSDDTNSIKRVLELAREHGLDESEICPEVHFILDEAERDVTTARE